MRSETSLASVRRRPVPSRNGRPGPSRTRSLPVRRGRTPSATYDGRGICYLEFGEDRVAKVEVTFTARSPADKGSTTTPQRPSPRTRQSSVAAGSSAGSAASGRRTDVVMRWLRLADVRKGPVPFSSLSHLECSRTGDHYDADQVQGVSKFGAPLLARYDLDQVRARLTRDVIAGRPNDLWRYHEVLPVRDPEHVTTLGEGMTPLLRLPTYGAAIGVPGLLMKDEGLIPTGDLQGSRRRGRCLACSRARREGDRDADEWKRRSRVVGVRHPLGDGQPDRDAGRRPGDHATRVCRVGRGALPRRRVDQPRRCPGEGRR